MHTQEIIALIDRLELSGVDVEIARADPAALYQTGVDLLALAGLLGYHADDGMATCAGCGQRAIAAGMDPDRPFRCDQCSDTPEPQAESLRLFAPVAPAIAGQLHIK